MNALAPYEKNWLWAPAPAGGWRGELRARPVARRLRLEGLARRLPRRWRGQHDGSGAAAGWQECRAGEPQANAAGAAGGGDLPRTVWGAGIAGGGPLEWDPA